MSFTKTEKLFVSSNGIDTVHCYVYTADNGVPPKAVLQICHGMCENMSRYEEFIEAACDAGYAVIGNDALGHGNTACCKSDLGYFALKYGWIYLIKDARSVTDLAHRMFPDKKIYMLGHSMGSLIVRAYISRYSYDISGTVIMGTVASHIGTSAGIALADTEIYLYGVKHRSKTISRILYDLGNLRITDRHTNMDWVSRDEREAANYITDERCNFVFTSSAFRDIFMMLEYCKSPKWYSKVRNDMPIYILSGTDDPVGLYGKGAASLFSGLEAHGFTDVEAKLCDGCRHELLHELNRNEITADIIRWLDTKLAVEGETE